MGEPTLGKQPMKLDYGRLEDLEICARDYKNAKYKHDREYILTAMRKIMSESVPLRSLREKLILATQAKDRVAVKKIIMHINYIRQNETYGKEIS